jgi:hypothetical protein
MASENLPRRSEGDLHIKRFTCEHDPKPGMGWQFRRSSSIKGLPCKRSSLILHDRQIRRSASISALRFGDGSPWRRSCRVCYRLMAVARFRKVRTCFWTNGKLGLKIGRTDHVWTKVCWMCSKWHFSSTRVYRHNLPRERDPSFPFPPLATFSCVSKIIRRVMSYKTK